MVPGLVGEEARLLKFTGAQLNFISNNGAWLVRARDPGPSLRGLKLEIGWGLRRLSWRYLYFTPAELVTGVGKSR